MSDRKQINFTIVPDEATTAPRTYANFCAVNHTPFDFTLSFCEVQPLSEKEIRDAEADHVVRAPRAAGAVHSDPDRGAPGEPSRVLRVACAAASRPAAGERAGSLKAPTS
jgi:hypothetical protein